MAEEQLFRALPRKNTEETEKKTQFPHLPTPNTKSSPIKEPNDFNGQQHNC